MPSEPDWLTAEDIAELNELIVEDSGEPFAIIKPNELESAAARPRFLFHYRGETDIATLAVRLMVAISQDHPFAEGNKRAGFIAARIFADENGFSYEGDDEEFAELLKSVITREATEEDLIEAFRADLYQMA